MPVVPTSVMMAIGCSAAAGKNPWIPLGLLFLLAAPESVPELFMDEQLHASLHDLGPPGLLWGLAATFLVVAVLESLADKIPFVETWLVPVSTAWRPFAAIAVSAIVGVAAADAQGVTEQLVTAGRPVATADTSWLLSGSLVVTCILAGAVYGWLATIGKTGTRLLLTLVPIPSIRIVHSFVDDLFAIVASIAGLLFADSFLLLAAAVLYLVVGLFTGPLLARLTWIHVRIGWGIFRKVVRRATKDAPRSHRPPRWLRRLLDEEGVTGEVTVLPCYTYKAPEVRRCRAGWLVLAPGMVEFATRKWLRPRLLELHHARIARLGYAESTTYRNVTLVDRTESGALREVVLYLFPATDDVVMPVLEEGTGAAGLVRVKAHSESARRGVPGYAHRGRSVRYLPADEAGSLRAQALMTILTAVIAGILTGGVFVPIGTGYAISPFPRRMLLGLAISGYLSLCVLATVGIAWPVALLYAIMLNVVALRDLSRAAIKARIDGVVDKRAFLPPVCSRVWVPAGGVADPSDRWQEGDGLPVTDGPWRAIVAVLAQPEDQPPPRAAEAGA